MSNMNMKARIADKTDKIVGSNIRMARKVAGISQQSLANTLNITFQQVQKYESGANRVSAGRLVAICAHLNIPLSQLFVGTAINNEHPAPDSKQAADVLIAFNKIDDVNKPSAIRILNAMAAA